MSAGIGLDASGAETGGEMWDQVTFGMTNLCADRHEALAHGVGRAHA